MLRCSCDSISSSFLVSLLFRFFFFNDTATTEIYTSFPTRRSSDLMLPVWLSSILRAACSNHTGISGSPRSEEHTSELQSLRHLVCRLLLEKKKKKHHKTAAYTQDNDKKRLIQHLIHCNTIRLHQIH